ncbi:hypothetical protein XENTR_v10010838 [Xenopus tropicalis]|nr:hypothetical protein XENTR_v10010838 [Xenopus tropicalis]
MMELRSSRQRRGWRQSCIKSKSHGWNGVSWKVPLVEMWPLKVRLLLVLHDLKQGITDVAPVVSQVAADPGAVT